MLGDVNTIEKEIALNASSASTPAPLKRKSTTNQARQVSVYLIADFLSAALAWVLFYSYRKYNVEPNVLGKVADEVYTTKFFVGILVIPTAWLLFYYLIGTYKTVYRKSRLLELYQTLLTSIIGVVVLSIPSA